MSAQSLNTVSTDENVALPLRSHTILGVCEALGEDFGINPTWIRIPFATIVLFSPLYAVLAYLAVGLIVLGSRMIFPKKRIANSAATTLNAPTASANRNVEEKLAA